MNVECRGKRRSEGVSERTVCCERTSGRGDDLFEAGLEARQLEGVEEGREVTDETGCTDADGFEEPNEDNRLAELHNGCNIVP